MAKLGEELAQETAISDLRSRPPAGQARGLRGRAASQRGRDIATGAEITTIARDISIPSDGVAVGRLTVDDYLDALARLMITEDLGA